MTTHSRGAKWLAAEDHEGEPALSGPITRMSPREKRSARRVAPSLQTRTTFSPNKSLSGEAVASKIASPLASRRPRDHFERRSRSSSAASRCSRFNKSSQCAAYAFGLPRLCRAPGLVGNSETCVACIAAVRRTERAAAARGAGWSSNGAAPRRSRSHSVKSRIGERYFQVFSDRSRSMSAGLPSRADAKLCVCGGSGDRIVLTLCFVLRLCDCVALTSRRSGRLQTAAAAAAATAAGATAAGAAAAAHSLLLPRVMEHRMRAECQKKRSSGRGLRQWRR